MKVTEKEIKAAELARDIGAKKFSKAEAKRKIAEFREKYGDFKFYITDFPETAKALAKGIVEGVAAVTAVTAATALVMLGASKFMK